MCIKEFSHKLIKFFMNNSIKVVILFFFLYSLYGCIVFDDYGITTDEFTQRYHSLVTYNDLFLKGKEYHTETIDTSSLPTLEEYGVNYGVILQLPLIFIEHMTGFQMTWHQIFSMRHLYNFFWFFISSIFFYKIAMILTGQHRYEALFCTMIYVLCPRIMADSFYNIKDLLCLSLFTISIYYCIRLIQKISISNLLLFVVFAALCATSRIVGGVIVLVCLLVLFMKSVKEGWTWHFLKYCIILGALFAGIFIIINPSVWNDIPNMLAKLLNTFSNYTTWVGSVKYMGQLIEGTDLPWHYLFVWILITTPTIYIILMCYGMVRGTHDILVHRQNHDVIADKKERDKRSEEKWIYLTLLLTMIIPFAYVIIVRPVLYNGWRHFYFMYSLISCWAAIGIHYLVHTKKKIWSFLYNSNENN